MEKIQLKKILSEVDRLSTFNKNWPHKDGPCTPENLAKAGFFYVGRNAREDCVRCFVCFKLLFGWKSTDDPFEEHRAHSENCEFVKIGQNQSDITLNDFLKLLNLSLKRTLDHIVNEKGNEERELIQSYDIDIE